MRRYFWMGCLLMCLLISSGCAGSNFVGNAVNNAGSYRTVYLVTDKEKEGKVSAGIQKSFLRHGMTVFETSSSAPPSTSALLVKYEASWSWDVVMYLNSLDMQFYDSTGSLVVSGTWKNGVLHGYQDPDDVTEEVISGALRKMGIVDATGAGSH